MSTGDKKPKEDKSSSKTVEKPNVEDKGKGKGKAKKDYTDEELIDILESTSRHITVPVRKLTSNILRVRLQEHEQWERETNAANVQVEHLQEEISEKGSENDELKKTIKNLEAEIKKLKARPSKSSKKQTSIVEVELKGKMTALEQELEEEKAKNSELIRKQESFKNDLEDIKDRISKIDI